MISSLRGNISRIFGNYIEVEVNNVGYLVFVGKNGFSDGENIKIYTYMAVSENDISLYGFMTKEELDLFKMLITVSGVGPKSAAQILGNTNSIDVIKAIGDANVEFFKKIKGIGLKTAQRIIVDLKSKIGGLGELNLKDSLPLLEDDLMLSLQQLGFEKKEIEQMVKGLPVELVEVEQKLEWCLRNRK